MRTLECCSRRRRIQPGELDRYALSLSGDTRTLARDLPRQSRLIARPTPGPADGDAVITVEPAHRSGNRQSVTLPTTPPGDRATRASPELGADDLGGIITAPGEEAEARVALVDRGVEKICSSPRSSRVARLASASYLHQFARPPTRRTGRRQHENNRVSWAETVERGVAELDAPRRDTDRAGQPVRGHAG